MQRKYSPYHIPLLSFFSDELYCDVGLNWKGTCLGYLFLLMAVCLMPYMMKIHTWYGNFSDNVAPALIIQFPKLRIVDGELSLSVPQPYYIIDPETEEVIVAIDTTGTLNSLDDTTAPVLITKTGVLTRSIDNNAYALDFSTVEDVTIDQTTITGWLDLMRSLVVPAVYPFAVLFAFAYRTVEAILYAAIGMLFVSWINTNFSFQAVLRLAVISLTPCIVGDAILVALGISIPFGGLFFFLIAMGYLFFGIKVCAQSIPPPTPSEYFRGGGYSG